MSIKGVERPVTGEGVDDGLRLTDAVEQLVTGVELIAPGGLDAFDAVVEAGPLGRQNKDFEAARFAFLLEGRFELTSTINLNATYGKGRLGDQLVEQRFGASCAEFGRDTADCPFGDGIAGGEVLDQLVRPDVDEERVDLNEFAGGLGLAALGQAAGIAFLGGEANASCARPAAKARRGDDGAACH